LSRIERQESGGSGVGDEKGEGVTMDGTTNIDIPGGVVHEVPEDLGEALTSDPEVLATWESLTPLARNEWICWTISVKRPETRREHVERVCSELKEGMRRPCCWYGCIHRTDKAVSPSVQAVVLDRRRKSK
jgi:hypothetical protein